MATVVTVLFGLGANLSGAWGTPAQSIARALTRISETVGKPVDVSSFYLSHPVGPIAQPDYVNAVARTRSDLSPEEILKRVKAIEKAAGRGGQRRRWDARELDIDLLDVGGEVLSWETAHDAMHPQPLVLPHPLLHERAFVLVPLMELDPDWRHPVFGLTAAAMLGRLPPASDDLRQLPTRAVPE